MNRIVLYLIFLLFISCGKHMKDMGNSTIPNATTDPEFVVFIEYFKADFEVEFNVPIYFGDVKLYSPTAAAVCLKWSNGVGQVMVDKEVWNKLNFDQKEQLVFHELGHCVLDKDHNDEHFVLGGNVCPVSIMRSYLFNKNEVDKCYNFDYTYYVEEMI